MVDKKAMNAAKEAFAERMDETNDSLFEVLEFAIEAYEAAKLTIGPESGAKPSKGLVHSIKTGDEARKAWVEIDSPQK